MSLYTCVFGVYACVQLTMRMWGPEDNLSFYSSEGIYLVLLRRALSLAWS